MADFPLSLCTPQPCCNWDPKKGDYVFPAKKKLQEYRVLITTLITASRLVSAQFPIDHFTHIFIDEAGHSMEPESLVAIAGEGFGAGCV